MTELDLNPFGRTGKFVCRRLHTGWTGSVAVYKMCDVLRRFLANGMHVSATITDGAREFITPLLLKALGALPVYSSMFADEAAVFPHLEPGQVADAFLVAPASADFIAKAATGSAADLLSCQTLAFNGSIAIAPAMNPRMWQNPATQENIARLAARNWKIITPASGSTACGDLGVGKLASQCEIYLNVLAMLAPQDMIGQNVLVTLGPTREFWDCARFLSNPSSGIMGAALATSAWLRGASVTVIQGSGINIYLPKGINCIGIESARDLWQAANDCWPDASIGMFCAAVADFHPLGGNKSIKIKKASICGNVNLESSPGADAIIPLAANPDILANLAARKKPDQKILGFAAEAAPDRETLLKLATIKMRSKNADLLAANIVTGLDGAFAKEESALLVIDKTGRQEYWPSQAKADSAWELCTWLLQI